MGEIEFIYPNVKSLAVVKISGTAKDMSVDEIRDYIDEKLYKGVGATLPSTKCFITHETETPEGKFVSFECFVDFSMDTYIKNKLEQ